jgi:hypothetical protein
MGRTKALGPIGHGGGLLRKQRNRLTAFNRDRVVPSESSSVGSALPSVGQSAFEWSPQIEIPTDGKAEPTDEESRTPIRLLIDLST